MNAYERFGQAAALGLSPVVVSGRFSFQREETECVVSDIVPKLRPQPGDRLLEIGCNVGLLLTPLSRLVDRAVGMDHPDTLARFQKVGLPANVQLVPGQWPEVQPEGDFDCILVYSVLHYLAEREQADRFVDACVARLRAGGRLLLGDLPNANMKTRFVTSPAGRQFESAWQARKLQVSEDDRRFQELPADESPTGRYLTDAYLLDLTRRLRMAGTDCFLLPQMPGLPFCNTREDLLVWKRS